MDYYDYNNSNHIEPTSNLINLTQPYVYGIENTPAIQNYDPRLAFQGTDFKLGVESDINLKSDDELWIEAWLSKIGKIQINLDSTIEIKPTKPLQKQKSNKQVIQIHQAKHYLKNCINVIQQLEETQNILRTNVTTMSSSEWKKKTIEIGLLKDELNALMSHVDNAAAVTTLKRSLQNRKKKRLQCKNRKVERREQLALMHENRKKLHESIDQWLFNMQDAVERVKMEEIMKRDADCVLSEVNKKKSDARKQLSLVCALIKLRAVRKNAAVQRGEKVSSEDRKAFAHVTEHITRMWEKSLKVYTTEEQGLKLMLAQNASEDVAKSDKKIRVLQEWDRVLFGPKIVLGPAYWGLTSAEKNFDTFVAIRKSWDTFLVSNDDQNGSQIPVGWILPPTIADENWKKYCLAEINT